MIPTSIRLPETIFLIFSAVIGLILVVLIPPLGGGNETLNFQRVAAIAAGHVLIEPAQVPGGIGRFLHAGNAQFREGSLPPYGYSLGQFRALAAIPLDAGNPATLQPNPIAVLHPFCYLPQLAAYWLGEAIDLPPLGLFLLGRLAGLLAGIGLTYAAIRRMPFHGYTLAALALLPTITFSRSTLDADQLTNGLAFFFVATVLREIAAEGPLCRRALIELAVTAFILAQCKSAYLVLPLLMLAIPAARFPSHGARAAASLAVILPGVAAALAWMILLKLTFFTGLRYHTWGGDVYPDLQSAQILHDPIGYLVVLLRTIFTTALVPQALIGLIGIFGPPVTMPVAYYPLVALAFCGVVLAEERRAPRPTLFTGLVVLAIVFGGAGLVLTLLYLQWTGLGADTIQGFQGRYLYPLLPVLVLLLYGRGRAFFGRGSGVWLIALGATTLVGTLWVTWSTYLASA